MRYTAALGVIAVVTIVLLLSSGISGNGQQASVCFESDCFDVSLALTSSEQSQGLMFVDRLDDDAGMLFVFDKPGIHPFWMKNTLIPLDIIWIDSGGSVVFINKDTQPCVVACDLISPGIEASYVLEINAGISDMIGLEVGDKMSIDYMK